MWTPSAHAEAQLVAARQEAESRHLARVGAWGVANLIGGSTVLLLSGDGHLRAAGLQCALWGAVNVTIASVGLGRSAEDGFTDLHTIHARERRLGHVMRLNLGLNAGYVLVGATMVGVSTRDVEHALLWRGHGAAIMAQGVTLLVLDGMAYAGSRQRQAALSRAVKLRPIPQGVALSVRL